MCALAWCVPFSIACVFSFWKCPNCTSSSSCLNPFSYYSIRSSSFDYSCPLLILSKLQSTSTFKPPSSTSRKDTSDIESIEFRANARQKMLFRNRPTWEKSYSRPTNSNMQFKKKSQREKKHESTKGYMTRKSSRLSLSSRKNDLP